MRELACGVRENADHTARYELVREQWDVDTVNIALQPTWLDNLLLL